MPAKVSAEVQAAKMRAENPECAKLADEMRAVFGNDLVVTAMSERGKFTARKTHKEDSEFSVVLNGDEFLRIGKLAKQANDFAEGNAGHGKRK